MGDSKSVSEDIATSLTIAEACETIRALKRLMLPAFMALAEGELLGEPEDPNAVVYHFMGSGASDMVTVGQFRAAMFRANAFLAVYDTVEDEGGENDGGIE